jgi:hypothetical protein
MTENAAGFAQTLHKMKGGEFARKIAKPIDSIGDSRQRLRQK